MITPFSRYVNNVVTPQVTASGAVKSTIIVEPPTSNQTLGVSTYTWQVDDQIEYLSASAYGDETQWWRIANANPEVLFWNSLTPGQQVRVPIA